VGCYRERVERLIRELHALDPSQEIVIEPVFLVEPDHYGYRAGLGLLEGEYVHSPEQYSYPTIEAALEALIANVQQHKEWVARDRRTLRDGGPGARSPLREVLAELLRRVEHANDRIADDGDGHIDEWQSPELEAAISKAKQLLGLDAKQE